MVAVPPQSEIQYQMSHASDDKGTPVVIFVAVFGFLALISLFGRLLHRARSDGGFSLEDYFILGAAAFGFAECLSIFEQAHFALGRHLLTVNPVKLVPWTKWNLVLGFCYAPAMLLAKFSILAFMYRIFYQGQKWLLWSIIVLAVYTFLWTLAVLLVIGLSCQPFDTYWSITAPCSPSETPTIITAAFNTAGDLAFILLPQPLIWRLQMSFTRKLSVSLLMCLGIFATVCGVIRIAIAKELNPFDATYTYADVGLFFVLEVLVTILCANLPTIYRPFIDVYSSLSGYVSSLGSISKPWSSASSSSSRGKPLESDQSMRKGGVSSYLLMERSAGSGSGSSEHYAGATASYDEDRQYGTPPKSEIHKRTDIEIAHSAH